MNRASSGDRIGRNLPLFINKNKHSNNRKIEQGKKNIRINKQKSAKIRNVSERYGVIVRIRYNSLSKMQISKDNERCCKTPVKKRYITGKKTIQLKMKCMAEGIL